MEPLSDFDRVLREAMQVEPGGDFAARVRARVATAPRKSHSLMPRFAVAAMTCALLAVVAAGVWRETDSAVQPPLPYRDLMVVSGPLHVPSSPPQPTPGNAPAFTANVVVSRSEMLALQRLFAGLTVAPPQLEAAPDELPMPEELSIPKIVIEPLVPVASGPEGERQ